MVAIESSAGLTEGLFGIIILLNPARVSVDLAHRSVII
jgi:hypothetical protein